MASEVQFVTIMVGQGSVQADTVLEKELRVLHLDHKQQEVNQVLH